MSAGCGFLAEAAEELELHRDYYERKAPGLGARFLIATHDAITAAMATPNAGAPVVAGARARRIARFPIRIIYVLRVDRSSSSRSPTARDDQATGPIGSSEGRRIAIRRASGVGGLAHACHIRRPMMERHGS